MTPLTAVGIEDAAAVIERFNAFHDGFIQRVSLCSRDRFTREGSDPWEAGRELTGKSDASCNNAGNSDSGPIERILRRDTLDWAVVQSRLEVP